MIRGILDLALNAEKLGLCVLDEPLNINPKPF
jgi:hypothetical protein